MPLPLPNPATEAIPLADWTEANALLCADLNSSLGDLETVLKRESIFDENPDRIEAVMADVNVELASRRKAAGSAYPFDLENGVLQASTDALGTVYVFCLLLSYLKWKQPKSHPEAASTYAARIFEEISTEAARRYVAPGEARRFGAPRVGKPPHPPKSFKQAINSLCAWLGEGDGWKHKKMPKDKSPQDGGIDIVAWRDWLDGHPGKLVLFGSCATGKNWDEKLRELDPTFFFPEWTWEMPTTPYLRAFFVPHRIPMTWWRTVTREAGIIFDRCRISSIVAKPPDVSHHGDIKKWVLEALNRLKKLS